MSNVKMAVIIAAAILVAVGLIVMIGVLATQHFNLSAFSTVTPVTNTYDFDDLPDEIVVDCSESDIRLLPYDRSGCRVVCHESEEIKHSVKLADGVLEIKSLEAMGQLINVMLGSYNIEVEIYLPHGQYERLKLKSVSGDIGVGEGYDFGEGELKTTSGDIAFGSSVKGRLGVNSTSGELTLSGVSAGELELKTTSGEAELTALDISGDLEVITTSGDVDMTDVICAKLDMETTSGELELEGVVLSGELRIKSTSGDIELDGCDAETLSIKTVSGNVSGRLLTAKSYYADTTSGRVDVPHTSGGECSVSTTSGAISFK